MSNSYKIATMGSFNCTCDKEVEDPEVLDSKGERKFKHYDQNTNSSSLSNLRLNQLIESDLVNSKLFTIWKNQDIYLYPNIYSDEITNYSVLYLAKGKYTGEDLNKQPHGRGYFIRNKEELLEGLWEYGQLQGLARVISLNGDVFQGHFIMGEISGYGIRRNFNGKIYEGFWERSKESGHGNETYPDGSTFSGIFKEGKKCGRGIFLWADSSKYEGEFMNDKFHGKGIYTWSDGKKYDGVWYEGKMQGKGTFFWPDKSKYIGDFDNDMKHGKGKYYWPDGNIYFGSWENGKKSGLGTVFIHSKNMRIKGQWKNGVRVKWILTNTTMQSSECIPVSII